MAVKFWMVLGSGAPTHRHAADDLAKREAERLARLHPGSEFIVLESIVGVRVASPPPPPIEETRYDEYSPDMLF